MSYFASKTRGGSHIGNFHNTNQDASIVIKNFANIQNVWYLGIFDGHGINGHNVSNFIKQNIPNQILKIFNNDSFNFFLEKSSEKDKAIIRAFEQTNKEIRTQRFDSKASGSTANTVMLIGTKLICANVGDSRAVLARYKEFKHTTITNFYKSSSTGSLNHDKSLVVIPLSHDHKPSVISEYKRILVHHGRVEPFRDYFGRSVGPPRVWLAKENGPGLAMSRSLGDLAATAAGIICTPEVVELELTKDDKFIILASDGLWEFISNERAVDIVSPYWYSSDPEGACSELITEALKKWKLENRLIDDITVIVVFLNIK